MLILVVMFVLVVVLLFRVNNGPARDFVVPEILIFKTIGKIQAANVSAVGQRS